MDEKTRTMLLKWLVMHDNDREALARWMARCSTLRIGVKAARKLIAEACRERDAQLQNS